MTTPAHHSAVMGDDAQAATTPKPSGDGPGKRLLVTLVLRRSAEGTATAHQAPVPAMSPEQQGLVHSRASALHRSAIESAISAVTSYVGARGMTVVEADAGRRTVIVAGSVAQMSAAFARDHSLLRLRPTQRGHQTLVPGSSTRTHRGGTGLSVDVPDGLAGAVQGLLMDFEWIRRVRAHVYSQRRAARSSAELQAV